MVSDLGTMLAAAKLWLSLNSTLIYFFTIQPIIKMFRAPSIDSNEISNIHTSDHILGHNYNQVKVIALSQATPLKY